MKIRDLLERAYEAGVSNENNFKYSGESVSFDQWLKEEGLEDLPDEILKLGKYKGVSRSEAGETVVFTEQMVIDPNATYYIERRNDSSISDYDKGKSLYGKAASRHHQRLS